MASASLHPALPLRRPPATLAARPPPLRWGGVEGGGTSWVCAVAEGEPDRIVARAEFPTTDPRTTLASVRAWLDARHAERALDALGVATFGPVDLDRSSPTYGHITHSPKPGWEAVDVLGAVAANLPPDLPIGSDTDVNAPAVAEFAAIRREAERRAADALEDNGDPEDDDASASRAFGGITNLAYVTVGAGVGVGLICASEPVPASPTPRRATSASARLASDGHPGEPGAFEGVCAYHGDCIEGMAGAAAIAKRAPTAPSRISPASSTPTPRGTRRRSRRRAHRHARDGGEPAEVVLGGGVLQRKTLVTKIRAHVKRQLGGYVRHEFVETGRGLWIHRPEPVGERGGDRRRAGARGEGARGGAEAKAEELEEQGGALRGGDLLGVRHRQGRQREAQHRRRVKEGGR